MFVAKLKTFGRFAVSASILLGAAACGDSTGTGDATLTLLLTDAPDPIYETVVVSIGEIEILRSDGAPVLITSMGGEDIDLLMLQEGVTLALGSVDLELGTYHQLRMVITAATVTLKGDLKFTDGTNKKTLTIPSGAQTGIKINLGDGSGIDIIPGETILVVDFDVTQNFKIQGSPDTPAGIQGVLFTPLLRAVVQNIAGSISGTISAGTDVSLLNDLVGASVHAMLLDSVVLAALQTSEGTGLIDSNGTYSINFLSPGTYDLTVETTTTAGVLVSGSLLRVQLDSAETKMGADFTVVP